MISFMTTCTRCECVMLTFSVEAFEDRFMFALWDKAVQTIDHIQM